MKRTLCFLGAFLAALAVISSPAARADGPDKVVFDKGVLQEGIEVAPRGPIHEAFAQPFNLNPEPSPVVVKQPPAVVPELPPEQRPEGDNVQWIPGYWAWDSDRNDYLWVSGVYRSMPQGRKYVPGYWAEAEGGYRWVAGYFAPEQQAEVPLVPQPPASLDTGPSIPAPDNNSFYTPGVWIYNGTEFVWRPGFWSAFRPGRVWVNSCYQWTPGGYMFVNGYWDYPLADRGLLFAPIYFNDPLWLRPGWFYRPRVAIGLANLFNYLWWRPAYPYYFYGNYFGPGFARLGFNPWWGGNWWGNSLHSYYRWRNPTWVAGVRQGFQNPGVVRPAFTPLNQMRSGLVNVSATQLNVQKTNIQNIRQLSVTRNRMETSVARQGNSVKTLNFSTGKTNVTPAVTRNIVNQGNITNNKITNNKTQNITRNQSVTNNKITNNKTQNITRNQSVTKNSFTPKVANTGNVPKQAFTGQTPSNSRQQNNNVIRNNNINNNVIRNNNINKGSSYQSKSANVGSQRQSNYSPKTTNYSGSTYRAGTAQSYRPSASYRPTTSYRPSTSSYRGSGTGRSASVGRGGGGGRSGGGRR